MRVPGDYSSAEFLVPQGHPDRVRSRDCRTADKYQRHKENNESDEESDWYDRTSIDPIKWCQERDVETELRKSREAKRALQEKQGIRDPNHEDMTWAKNENKRRNAEAKRKAQGQNKSSKTPSKKK